MLRNKQYRLRMSEKEFENMHRLAKKNRSKNIRFN